MIESLGEHGVVALDLVPALMTTHTVANPEYDPEEARRKSEDTENMTSDSDDDDDDTSTSNQTLVKEPLHDIMEKEETDLTDTDTGQVVTAPETVQYF